MNNAHILQDYRAADNRFAAVFEVFSVTVLMALCAHAKLWLPFTEVPLTLQTLPALAMPFIVGRDRATWGILIYLVLGAVQVPVFATYGATGGFLVAFALVPYIVTRFSPALGLFIATLFIYAMGTAWYCFYKEMMPLPALMLTVVPFIPGDIIKAGAAYALARHATRDQDAASPASQ